MQSFNQLPDYTTLPTVEHVLPQAIDTAWKSYLANDANDAELPKYTNTLGNLCLLSQPIAMLGKTLSLKRNESTQR